MSGAPWVTRDTLTVTVTTYPPRAPWEGPIHCAQVFDPADGVDAMPVSESWSELSGTVAARKAFAALEFEGS
jgi:hypothetical protein